MEVCVGTGRRGALTVSGNSALAAIPARSGAFEWARWLGILGLTATEKKVPAPVFCLRDQDIELFLGRLWPGDGFISCKGNNHVPFYAISSAQLAKDIQAFLLPLAIPSGV